MVRLEEATLATWPALVTVRDGAWVMRRAEGHTGRANSLAVLDPDDDANCRERLDAVVAFYRDVGLTPRIRLTPLTPAALAAELEARGWTRYGEVIVMSRDLASVPLPSAPVEYAVSATPDWLADMGAFMGFSDARRDAIGRKLAHLAAPAAYFTRRDGAGVAIATALAIATNGLVGLFDVGVDPDHRRQGHAAFLALAALAWGSGEGAATAFLQVEAGNASAIALYGKLGFSEAYRYIYAIPPSEKVP